MDDTKGKISKICRNPYFCNTIILNFLDNIWRFVKIVLPLLTN